MNREKRGCSTSKRVAFVILIVNNDTADIRLPGWQKDKDGGTPPSL
jgi:hypothetical protein